MTRQEINKRLPVSIEPFGFETTYDEDYKIKVAASLNHFDDSMKKMLETLNPIDVVRLGGAGNKINRIALNEVDSYVQPRAGLGFWDLCAPEVILRGMGGVITNF